MAKKLSRELDSIALKRGNYQQPDGSTVIGWKIPQEVASAMGPSQCCVPSELEGELKRLIKLACWWQSGATSRAKRLEAVLQGLFPDDREMRRRAWGELLVLVTAYAPPKSVKLTKAWGITYGNGDESVMLDTIRRTRAEAIEALCTTCRDTGYGEWKPWADMGCRPVKVMVAGRFND